MPRERLDAIVCLRGLAESRELAQRMIRAGLVLVRGRLMDKPGHRIDVDAEVALKARPRFVSRGGEKLEAAFGAFALDVRGRRCLDVGASTGGFTDCLLQHGATEVVAVDVGRAQLHWRLAQDPRVHVLDQCNARHLRAEDLPFAPEFCTIDASFISLTLILPPVVRTLAAGAGLVTLIKPRFEAGREIVERGGVVRRPEVHAAVVERIRRFGTEAVGLVWLGVCESPVRGPAGNVEFLAHWRAPRGGEEPTGGLTNGNRDPTLTPDTEQTAPRAAPPRAKEVGRGR